MRPELKADVLFRLKSTEGHLRGVRAMVANDRPSDEVLHQLRALQGALSAVHNLLLCDYLASELRISADGLHDTPEALKEALLALVEQQQNAG
ncbi:MAG: metal-sensing transcriptional repressor [Chloroflexi bacterium]|nr:metal-sensing transcriptional repressor [Chloroflexota bacterium]